MVGHRLPAWIGRYDTLVRSIGTGHGPQRRHAARGLAILWYVCMIQPIQLPSLPVQLVQ